MLKPYHGCEAGLGPDCVASSPAAVNSVMSSVELSSADLGKSVSACVVVVSSAESVRPAVTSVVLTIVSLMHDHLAT